MEQFDLVIAVRCHEDPSRILDTVDSFAWSCDPKSSIIICAVDGITSVADELRKRSSNLVVYCSPRNNGWGIGLWTLLAETVSFAESTLRFGHFLSVDYDTLAIGKGVDSYILSKITHPLLGMLGKHVLSHEHWKARFLAEQKQIEEVLGKTPRSYTYGEGVQGGCMLLTRAFLNRLRIQSYLSPPVLHAQKFSSIADDHFIPLLCRYCGLDIKDVGPAVSSQWRAAQDPRGLEKIGIKIFHPIKMGPKNQCCGVKTEWDIRNYFRELRGRKPLPV